MPVLPGNRTRQPASHRNEGTWIAMGFMIGIIMGLFALVSLIIPDIFGLLAVLAAFGGFVTLHYLTWGRWLMRKQATIRREAPSSTAQEAADQERSPREDS